MFGGGPELTGLSDIRIYIYSVSKSKVFLGGKDLR